VLHASSYETDNALLRMRPELADEPQRRLIKKGYKAQCSTVLSQVMTLVNLWHSSCASVIVEGVHLHLKQVMQMMAKHPSILPFLVRFSAGVLICCDHQGLWAAPGLIAVAIDLCRCYRGIWHQAQGIWPCAFQGYTWRCPCLL
jgi:hypothetical protein